MFLWKTPIWLDVMFLILVDFILRILQPRCHLEESPTFNFFDDS